MSGKEQELLIRIVNDTSLSEERTVFSSIIEDIKIIRSYLTLVRFLIHEKEIGCI